MTEVVGHVGGGPGGLPRGARLAGAGGGRRHDPARARSRDRPGRLARSARGGPPAGPADPRRVEPAGLPDRDRGARRPPRRTAASWSSTARATPRTTPIRTPSSGRSGTSWTCPRPSDDPQEDPPVLDMNVVGWIVVGLPGRRHLGRARRRLDRAWLPAEHRRRDPGRSHRRLAGDRSSASARSRASSPRSSSPCFGSVVIRLVLNAINDR